MSGACAYLDAAVNSCAVVIQLSDVHLSHIYLAVLFPHKLTVIPYIH